MTKLRYTATIEHPLGEAGFLEIINGKAHLWRTPLPFYRHTIAAPHVHERAEAVAMIEEAWERLRPSVAGPWRRLVFIEDWPAESWQRRREAMFRGRAERTNAITASGPGYHLLYEDLPDQFDRVWDDQSLVWGNSVAIGGPPIDLQEVMSRVGGDLAAMAESAHEERIRFSAQFLWVTVPHRTLAWRARTVSQREALIAISDRALDLAAICDQRMDQSAAGILC